MYISYNWDKFQLTMEYQSRKQFSSDDEYGKYVKSKLKEDMTVICSNAYEDIKLGDLGKVVKVSYN